MPYSILGVGFSGNNTNKAFFFVEFTNYLGKKTVKNISVGRAVVTHAFNPSIQQAEAIRSLSSRTT